MENDLLYSHSSMTVIRHVCGRLVWQSVCKEGS